VVAQDYLGEKVSRAVVTVPAYFTDRQRQAVKDAGKLIQLEVVRIINEPTAAALAYGIGKNLHETVVIYDLGGGTFDVSIIEIRDRVFEVKATGGDIFLGGLDFDQAMIQYVLREFAGKNGIDLSTDPVAMQRIKDLAERVKIDLSSREQAPFSVPFVTMTAQGQPLNIDFVFTRGLLEEITKDLIDRTVEILTRVMNDAGLDPRKVDELLLVGGQTRMPAVQKRLTEIFGKTPSKGVHPDEAVAIGAALYANSLEDNSNLRLQLLDVIPMAIGLEKAGGEFHEVFPRNAPIPNAKAVPATTSYDGQTEVAMRIFQGDNDHVAHNELLGDFLFSGLKPGPAGRARLEITFDVNIEGILTMSARDLDTGKQMKTTVRVTQH
jgi:molecular chaperone DnaK